MPGPKVEKDSEGRWIITGVENKKITQGQADYQDLLKAAQLLPADSSARAKSVLRTNPLASGGLLAGLVQNNAVPNNELAKSLINIDQLTKQQRELDQYEERRRLETEKFKNSTLGQLWGGAKAAIRTLFIGGQTVLEGVNAGVRGLVNAGEQIWTIPKFVEGVRKGEVDFLTGESKIPGKTAEELGYFGGKEYDFTKNVLEEVTLFQGIRDLVQEGRIEFGEGFFPSEEIGAGFKARQKQLESKNLVVKMGDRTYVRPYSVADPVVNLITGGNADTQFGTLLSALGEVLVFWKTDPIIIASKAKRKRDDLLRQIQTTKGKVEAKKITALASAEAELEAANKKTVELLNAWKISPKSTADETYKAYDDALQEQLKIAQRADDLSDAGYDANAISQFLSSDKSVAILDTLAEMDYYQIYNLGKAGPRRAGFTWDQAVALGKATNRDEVLRAIAPYIDNGSVIANVLETGTKTGRFLSRVSAGADTIVPNVIKTNAARVMRQIPYVSRIANVIGQAYGLAARPMDYVRKAYNTVVPSKSLVHYMDTDLLASNIMAYGRIANVPESSIKGILDNLAASTDPQTGAFKAATSTMDEIVKANSKRVDPKLLKDVTRIFENGKKEMSKYWADRHAAGAKLEYMFSNGRKVNLSGPHLDSELLNSMMYFPDAKELIKAISFSEKLAVTRGARNAADYLVSNLWKKFVLVRPAYVIRNIMEEQVRVFLSGHISFFNRPVAAMAMWLGREQSSNPVRRLLAKFDPYKHTVAGPGFKLGSASDEFAAEAAAHGMVDDYLKYVQDNVTTSIERDAVKIAQVQRFDDVSYGHPRFFDAIANEIRMLSNSVAARAVIINENNPKAAIDYLLRGAGKDEWTRFANSKDKDVKDFLLSDDGLMMYLYTGKDESGRLVSLAARIEEVSGNGGASSYGIKSLIANGEFKSIAGTLSVPRAVDSAANSIKNAKEVTKGRKAIQDVNQEFGAKLKNFFDGEGSWDNIRFKVPEQLTFADTKENFNIVDWFFDVAVKFEKQTTMGPEWRQKYWDAIYDIAPGLDEAAVAKLAETAEKSLSPLVSWTGVNIGKSHRVWDAFKSTKKGGTITAEEANIYASNVANRHVANLFYDASKKRLLYHQLRLILPFGQAWDDTIQAWGRLALDNPDQIYKAGKALDWLTSSESSALYQLTDARDVYDPNQGFFFSEKRTGERRLFVPFLGTGINIIANIGSGRGFSAAGPYTFTATPQSFNFAFASGSIIPGFGPGITFAISLLDNLGRDPLRLLPAGFMRESAEKVLFPFGRPDVSQGVVETFLLSGNWRRLLSGPFVEAAYASSFAPTMSYLLNGGEYDLNDVEDQGRLVKDTVTFSKWFTTMRGFFGFISAAPLQPEAITKDGDGNTLLAASLYNDFKELEVNSGGNYNRAYADFLDLYGPQNIFAIIGTTTGAPTNLMTYEKILKDPGVVDSYKDTYGYFYPSGGFSQELYNWQRRRGEKERLSAEEIVQRATSIRYYAAKDRLLTRAMAEEWSSERLDAAKKNLADSYAMRGLVQEGDFFKNKRVMAQLREATNDSRFADSDAVNGLRRYLFFRDTALKAAGKKPDGTLASQGTIEQRKWLAEKAKQIIADNPEFYKMFYSFFRNELDVE